MSKFSAFMGRFWILVALDTKEFVQDPHKSIHVTALGTRLLYNPILKSEQLCADAGLFYTAVIPSVITDVCGAAASGPQVLENISATAQVQGEAANHLFRIWTLGQLTGKTAERTEVSWNKTAIRCLKLGCCQ